MLVTLTIPGKSNGNIAAPTPDIKTLVHFTNVTHVHPNLDNSATEVWFTSGNRILVKETPKRIEELIFAWGDETDEEREYNDE